MRRSVLVVITMLAGLLVAPVAFGASTASAACAPDGSQTIYVFRNKTVVYQPTNLFSNWATFPAGGSITYQQTTTKEVNASMTATVEAEAGVIFAKASTSFGVTIGGSYSKSASWSYTANVPADRTHMYRLHQYHYSLSFEVMKKRWSNTTCDWTLNVWGSWQKVNHAPEKNESSSVWRLDQKAA